MSVTLRSAGSNQAEVTIGDITLYFSYQTCVALRANGQLTVSQNEWSRTTAKHLSAIDGGGKDAKAKRIPYDQFTAILNAHTHREKIIQWGKR